MNWEEVSKYVWRGPNTGKHFIFEVRDNVVYYKTTEDPNWIRLVCASTFPTLIDLGYTIVGDNPEYVGIPLQEKICKKIALMEERWLAFRERKCNG